MLAIIDDDDDDGEGDGGGGGGGDGDGDKLFMKLEHVAGLSTSNNWIPGDLSPSPKKCMN